MIEKILSDPDLIIATIAVFIALLSIIIGVLSLWTQRVHNRKSVKPIGNIVLSDYENNISVDIFNAGVGPLFIKKVIVKKQDEKKTRKNIIDWMPKTPEEIDWTSFFADATGFVIPANDSLNLIQLKTGKDISKSFADFRDTARKTLCNLIVEIEFTDIYEKKINKSQPLEWFGRHFKKK